MDRQPAQAEASPAERSDLLRHLVPVISPAADGRGESPYSPEAMIASTTSVHDPHPDRLPIPDDHLSSTGRIKDANADLF